MRPVQMRGPALLRVYQYTHKRLAVRRLRAGLERKERLVRESFKTARWSPVVMQGDLLLQLAASSCHQLRPTRNPGMMGASRQRPRRHRLQFRHQHQHWSRQSRWSHRCRIVALLRLLDFRRVPPPNNARWLTLWHRHHMTATPKALSKKARLAARLRVLQQIGVGVLRLSGFVGVRRSS